MPTEIDIIESYEFMLQELRQRLKANGNITIVCNLGGIKHLRNLAHRFADGEIYANPDVARGIVKGLKAYETQMPKHSPDD